MSKCFNCGTVNQPNAGVCASCGRSLTSSNRSAIHIMLGLVIFVALLAAAALAASIFIVR